MANIARVRVELKKKYNDPEKNFREMFQEFKRQVSNVGVLHDLKDHQEFESPSQKRRRKKQESIKKYRHERLEEQILAGERVKAPSGIVKKILAGHKKKESRNKRTNS